MKKFLAFSAAVATLATLEAGMIDWDIDSVIENGDTDITASADNIVFISQSNATYDPDTGALTVNTAPSGSNSDVFTDDGVTYGTWTDSLADGTSYYMAVSDGNGGYLAITDGESTSPLTFATTANESGGPNPSGSSSGGAASLGGSSPRTTTYAASVPEPATAVMALAGLALLLRRRK